MTAYSPASPGSDPHFDLSHSPTQRLLPPPPWRQFLAQTTRTTTPPLPTRRRTSLRPPPVPPILLTTSTLPRTMHRTTRTLRPRLWPRPRRRLRRPGRRRAVLDTTPSPLPRWRRPHLSAGPAAPALAGWPLPDLPPSPLPLPPAPSALARAAVDPAASSPAALRPTPIGSFSGAPSRRGPGAASSLGWTRTPGRQRTSPSQDPPPRRGGRSVRLRERRREGSEAPRSRGGGASGPRGGPRFRPAAGRHPILPWTWTPVRATTPAMDAVVPVATGPTDATLAPPRRLGPRRGRGVARRGGGGLFATRAISRVTSHRPAPLAGARARAPEDGEESASGAAKRGTGVGTVPRRGARAGATRAGATGSDTAAAVSATRPGERPALPAARVVENASSADKRAIGVAIVRPLEGAVRAAAGRSPDLDRPTRRPPPAAESASSAEKPGTGVETAPGEPVGTAAGVAMGRDEEGAAGAERVEALVSSAGRRDTGAGTAGVRADVRVLAPSVPLNQRRSSPPPPPKSHFEAVMHGQSG